MNLDELIQKLTEMRDSMRKQGETDLPLIVGVPVTDSDGQMTAYPTVVEYVLAATVQRRGQQVPKLSCVLMVCPEYNIKVVADNPTEKAAPPPIAN